MLAGGDFLINFEVMRREVFEFEFKTVLSFESERQTG